MAWWDDAWSNVEDFFDDIETPDVNEILFGDGSMLDQHAQDLFREAFFENNDSAYIELVDYMWDQYNIDFEDAFSWEDFREWYG